MVRSLASVIVLARNRLELTRACLEALAASDAALEVLLLDNASTDDTPTLEREFAGRFGRFVYRRSPRNLSFSIANNRMARNATADVLVFLNNDVVVDPDAIRVLATTAAITGGVAGARLLFPGRERIQHAGMKQMLWGYASNLGTGAPADHPLLDDAGETFAVTGAMLAMPAALFRGIGGFDERYRWGYEDVDLCLAAHAAGAPVRYVPSATAVHVESATLGSVRRTQDLSHNYARYRRRWNHRLVPDERAAFERLRRQGVRRTVVFGTGLAARGLTRAFRRYGIDIVAYTETTATRTRFAGRPVVPLDGVAALSFDRLVVASQHFHALESHLHRLDPTGSALFPLASPWDRHAR